MSKPSTTTRASQDSSSTRDPASDLQCWEQTLDALEAHHGEIRAGLALGALPEPYAVAMPQVPFPPQLADRARVLQAAQREIEDEVRERLSLIGTVLSGAFPAAPPVAYYLDRRS